LVRIGLTTILKRKLHLRRRSRLEWRASPDHSPASPLAARMILPMDCPSFSLPRVSSVRQAAISFSHWSEAITFFTCRTLSPGLEEEDRKSTRLNSSHQ